MKDMTLKEMYDRVKCREYDAYIRQHTQNVQKCYEQFIRPILTDEALCSRCDEVVSQHDASKWNPDEYDAYAHYFYIDEVKDERSFDYAWLAHQHKNPHHWQSWVLMRDSGEKTPLDMPEEYIIEMLCDWSSFQYRVPGSTAANWYTEHSGEMTLSENTKQTIDRYLQNCEGL